MAVRTIAAVLAIIAVIVAEEDIACQVAGPHPVVATVIAVAVKAVLEAAYPVMVRVIAIRVLPCIVLETSCHRHYKNRNRSLDTGTSRGMKSRELWPLHRRHLMLTLLLSLILAVIQGGTEVLIKVDIAGQVR